VKVTADSDPKLLWTPCLNKSSSEDEIPKRDTDSIHYVSSLLIEHTAVANSSLPPRHYLCEMENCGKYNQDSKYKTMWQKHFVCFLGSQLQLLFTYKTQTLSFTRWCNDIIQVSWKTFKLLYCKFIQDNVYQILSEPTWFCGRYDKNILVCFFGSQCGFVNSLLSRIN